MAKYRLLMVEDDAALARAWARTLKRDFSIVCVHTVAAAMQTIESPAEFDAVWSDNHLGQRGDGVQVLRVAADRYPGAVLLMVTGAPDAPELGLLPVRVQVFDKNESAVAMVYLLGRLGVSAPGA